MNKLLVGLLVLRSFSIYASDSLRESYKNANSLTSLEELKTFEYKDKHGDIYDKGGKWNCLGDGVRKLVVRPMYDNDVWWSPKTPASQVHEFEGKVLAFSPTSSKQIGFRTDGEILVLEYSSDSKSEDLADSVEDPNRKATGYARCTKL